MYDFLLFFFLFFFFKFLLNLDKLVLGSLPKSTAKTHVQFTGFGIDKNS